MFDGDHQRKKKDFFSLVVSVVGASDVHHILTPPRRDFRGGSKAIR
jgi:hypothetical protein